MASGTCPADAAVGERLIASLRDCGALLEGHFLLSSGRHAGGYVQCARLLQHPGRASGACQDLAATVRQGLEGSPEVRAVVGPALGAVTLAYELARALGCRGLFAERAADGEFALRRGLSVEPGEAVLVAEDVVTTGGSVNQVVSLLREHRAQVLGVAALVNRSGQESVFGPLPFFRLLDLEVPSWEAEACPLCQEGAGPPVKPGSRRHPA